MSVTIPAGVGSGTILRLEGQGMPYYQGGPTGSLVLTITITSEEHSLPKQQSDEGPTALMSSEIVLDGQEQVVAETAEPFSHSDPSETKEWQEIRATIPSSPSQGASAFFRGHVSKSFLISLGLFIVVVGGLFATVHFGLIHAGNIGVNSFATATSVPTDTPTALPTDTPTAIPTATESAYNQDTSGTPAISDPLSDNRNNWGVFTTSWGGQCAFTGGAYHVSLSQAGYLMECTGSPIANLSNNFVLQVDINIQQGNDAAVIFGDDHKLNAFRTDINSAGEYTFYVHDTQPNEWFSGNDTASNPAIKAGFNQTNVVTIVMDDNNFSFYVNSQLVETSYLNAYVAGGTELAAYSINQPTDVAFSNLKIWNLTS